MPKALTLKAPVETGLRPQRPVMYYYKVPLQFLKIAAVFLRRYLLRQPAKSTFTRFYAFI